MTAHLITRFQKPLYIQFGSRRTVIVNAAKKILVDEPAYAAVSATGREAISFGQEAKALEKMSAEDITVISFFSRGKLVDEHIASSYFSSLFAKLSHTYLHLFFPYPVVCAVPIHFPPSHSNLLARTLSKAHMLPVAFYPSLVGDCRQGLGEDFKKKTAFTLRVGGTLTQAALFVSGSIVHSASIPMGGQDFDELLAAAIFRKYGVVVPLFMLESVKEEYTKATSTGASFSAILRGKDITKGTIASVQLTAEDLHEVAQRFFSDLISLVFYEFREVDAVIMQPGGRTSFFISGGCAVFAELSSAVEAYFGIKPSLLGRSHVASILGIAQAFERGEI